MSDTPNDLTLPHAAEISAVRSALQKALAAGVALADLDGARASQVRLRAKPAALAALQPTLDKLRANLRTDWPELCADLPAPLDLAVVRAGLAYFAEQRGGLQAQLVSLRAAQRAELADAAEHGPRLRAMRQLATERRTLQSTLAPAQQDLNAIKAAATTCQALAAAEAALPDGLGAADIQASLQRILATLPAAVAQTCPTRPAEAAQHLTALATRTTAALADDAAAFARMDDELRRRLG